MSGTGNVKQLELRLDCSSEINIFKTKICGGFYFIFLKKEVAPISSLLSNCVQAHSCLGFWIKDIWDHRHTAGIRLSTQANIYSMTCCHITVYMSYLALKTSSYHTVYQLATKTMRQTNKIYMFWFTTATAIERFFWFDTMFQMTVTFTFQIKE